MKTERNQIEQLPLNSYNGIAPFYDLLGDVVFFGALTRAQKAHLGLIPPRAKILIIGGGTGRILKNIRASNPESDITFVDASAEMLSRAKRRIPKDPKLNFIHGRVDDIPSDAQYEVIMCHFFLDQFSNVEIRSLGGIIRRKLSGKGMLMVSDFVADARWKRVIIRGMYAAFAMAGAVKRKDFPEWERVLEEAGFSVNAKASLFADFIRSNCYRLHSV